MTLKFLAYELFLPSAACCALSIPIPVIGCSLSPIISSPQSIGSDSGISSSDCTTVLINNTCNGNSKVWKDRGIKIIESS